MMALFPRFCVEKHWDEDGLLFGIRDSWTKQLLFNSWLPDREEAIRLALCEEYRVRAFRVHDCYLNSMTRIEYAVAYRSCVVCDAFLGMVE